MAMFSAMGNKFKTKRLRPIFIKEWLKHLGIKQTTLAQMMEVRDPDVTRWINDPQRITLDVISGIADALVSLSPELEDVGNLFRHPESVQSMAQARDAARNFIDALSVPPARDANFRLVDALRDSLANPQSTLKSPPKTQIRKRQK